MTGVEIALIAGAVVGGVSAVQQGRAQERSAKANAEFNAKVARDEAAQKAAAGIGKRCPCRADRFGLATGLPATCQGQAGRGSNPGTGNHVNSRPAGQSTGCVATQMGT